MSATKTERTVKGLLGTKLGMTQLWDANNRVVPVTVVEAGPCVVTQVRTPDVDGYSAVQLGFGAVKAKQLTKPSAGHFEKAGVTPRKHLVEIRTSDASEYSLGQELSADVFAAGDVIDVTGVSKGKGTAGVMKRHGFSGLRASHGVHRKHRAPGSIGGCATPGRFSGAPHGRAYGCRARHRAKPAGPWHRRRSRPDFDQGRNSGQQGRPGRPAERRQEGRRGMSETRTVDVLDVKGAKAGTAELPADLFDVPANIPLIHQVVTAQLAATRQGTHATKTRGEVRGGGRKPYRQKGTGRARQGSRRAPQFVGGGIVHGPQPRNYAQRTPKKMITAPARRVVGSSPRRPGARRCGAGLGDTPSTSRPLRAGSGSQLSKVLVVIHRDEDLAWLSLRNVGPCT
jgi:large subunit ribosomal protein L3